MAIFRVVDVTLILKKLTLYQCFSLDKAFQGKISLSHHLDMHLNDTYRHEADDRLLKKFSESLSTCSRPEDQIYRLGDDEFTLILNGAWRPTFLCYAIYSCLCNLIFNNKLFVYLFVLNCLQIAFSNKILQSQDKCRVHRKTITFGS